MDHIRSQTSFERVNCGETNDLLGVDDSIEGIILSVGSVRGLIDSKFRFEIETNNEILRVAKIE